MIFKNTIISVTWKKEEKDFINLLRKLCMNKKPLILVTNDDGISAPGLRALIKVMSDIGRFWL